MLRLKTIVRILIVPATVLALVIAGSAGHTWS